jgi:hypothetical protein
MLLSKVKVENESRLEFLKNLQLEEISNFSKELL